MDQLLDTGADAKAVDKRKVSALHYACGQGRLEVLQRLYRRGVELDVEDPGEQWVYALLIVFTSDPGDLVLMAQQPSNRQHKSFVGNCQVHTAHLAYSLYSSLCMHGLARLLVLALSS